jgi:hypothetical protein
MVTKLIFSIAGALIVAGCHGNPKTGTGEKAGSDSISNTSEQAVDSSYLFNGRNLDGWEVTNFGAQGPVFVSGGSIILSMGDAGTGITWKKPFPENSYEVTLEAKRVDGNDFFCGMTFPVGKSPCSLIVGGWGGSVVGLSSLDGLDASENETMTLQQFTKNAWYYIRLKVYNDSIKAWINNTPVVEVSTTGRTISIRPEVELSKPFGIASWRTTAAIRNIRLRRIRF